MDLAQRRPPLPAHLTKPVGMMGLAFCAYALLLFVIPAALSIVVVEKAPFVWMAILLLVPLWLLAQQGIHLLGMVGHEGFHGTLHADRAVSIHIGLFFSSMAISNLATGYFLSHWRHHLLTNTDEDPDLETSVKFRTFWSRFLLSRMAFARIYRRDTYRLAFGAPIAETHLPYGVDAFRVFARFNIAYQLFWIAAYASLAFGSWTWLLVAVIVPHVLAALTSGIRIYIEHAATDAEPGRVARSFSSPFWSVMFFGNNMHLEHHLYPNMPCYRLPAVHAWLKEQGYFERAGSHIEPAAVAIFKYAGARYPYPPDVAAAVPDTLAVGGVYTLLPSIDSEPLVPGAELPGSGDAVRTLH